MAKTLTCLSCRHSFLEVQCVLVPTLPGRSLAIWCEACDAVLSIGAKKSLITEVINERRAADGLDHGGEEDGGHRWVEYGVKI
jgi:hypothetical protein